MFGYEKRIEQLEALKKGMVELTEEFKDAIYEDLGRHKNSTELLELTAMIKLCESDMDHLSKWMQDVTLDPCVLWTPSTLKLHYEPLGVALIISSWNYPIFTYVKPLINAIVAGNCAVMKPSELAPAVSNVLQKLVDKYLDNSCFRVCQGGPPVAIKLTSMPFDLICFTGSTEKGKLVSAAAGKNLVPVIMELGGKCPAIVDDNADFDYAAFKICAAKFQNAGQTCIGVDYVMVHKDQYEKLIERILYHTEKQFGTKSSTKYNSFVGKCINSMSVERLQGLINSSGGQVILGGSNTADIKDRWLAPTIIKNPSKTSELMQNEIFGPVLPILTYSSFSEVIQEIQNRGKPLAIYYFGSTFSHRIQMLQRETSSGALAVNEAMMQVTESETGFGGVGHSGSGRCSGYEAFKMWSNGKAVNIKNVMNFFPYNITCPPFDNSRTNFLKFLLQFMNLRQGVILGALFKLILLFIVYKFFLGAWGDCEFRTRQVQSFVNLIKLWYGVN